MKTFGQGAYEGYCACNGGKSLVSGAALPQWDNLTTPIICSGDAAGIAVLNFLEQQQTKVPAQLAPAARGEGVNDGDVRVWPDPEPVVYRSKLP